MTATARGPRWIAGAVVALYLYFLLPATATGLYELYHLIPASPIYYSYGAFKAAGYYFGTWPYQLFACIAAGLVVALLPWLWGYLRRRSSQ